MSHPLILFDSFCSPDLFSFQKLPLLGFSRISTLLEILIRPFELFRSLDHSSLPLLLSLQGQHYLRKFCDCAPGPPHGWRPRTAAARAYAGAQ